VDPNWAQALLSQAAQRRPRFLIRHVGTFPTPWGHRLFEEAVLRDPYRVVGMTSARCDPKQAILNL
jgi:hypothetical protein